MENKTYHWEVIGEGVIHSVIGVRFGDSFYCLDCFGEIEIDSEAEDITGYEEGLEGVKLCRMRTEKRGR